jgi:hypothetical protein
MNRYQTISSVIIILLMALSGSALADVAPDPLTAGEALQQRDKETTDVRMVAEDVLVRVFECEIITVAEFSMYNEGETVTMEVGFPYLYQGNFIEFRAYVDDREVKVREGKQENVGRKKTTILWKLWDMTFEKEGSCKIRVEYRTKVYEHEHSFIWTEYYIMPQTEIDEAQRLTKYGSVTYYLDTGKAWKGVLDHCRVEFELVGRTDANIESSWPEGGIFTGSGMVWEYSDYEPTGRVTLQYYPNMAVKSVPEYMFELLEKYPNDPHLASSIGTKLYGRLHDIDLSSEVYHSFLANWDGQIPQLMEYASGGRCRFNYKGAAGDFYTIWRMAKLLFMQYERQGTLEKAVDIAPNVSKICSAIADSLDTCGNLPESNAHLYEDAVYLLNQSNSLIDTEK